MKVRRVGIRFSVYDSELKNTPFVARELAPAGVRSAPKLLGPLRSPAGASSLATKAFSGNKSVLRALLS
ncbi:hypothetical protein DBR46_26025 [Pseudomonas sp. KBW05]|nr:hypothetical protein DBR46_26025 [Pseudomonas sp. KBW05]